MIIKSDKMSKAEIMDAMRILSMIYQLVNIDPKTREKISKLLLVGNRDYLSIVEREASSWRTNGNLKEVLSELMFQLKQ